MKIFKLNKMNYINNIFIYGKQYLKIIKKYIENNNKKLWLNIKIL